MGVIDVGEAVGFPLFPSGDVDLDDSVEGKVLQAVEGFVSAHGLEDREVGAVEEEATVGGLHDPGVVLKEMEGAHKGCGGRVLREHQSVGLLLKGGDGGGHLPGRGVAEDGGEQEEVPSFPAAEVPEPRVSTEPAGVQRVCEIVGCCYPGGVEVLGLFEVDVQEMIGGWKPGLNPPSHVLIEAPAHIGAHLKKVDELRIGLPGVESVEVEGPGAAVKFTGDPDSEPREVGEAFCKGSHRGDHAQIYFNLTRPLAIFDCFSQAWPHAAK